MNLPRRKFLRLAAGAATAAALARTARAQAQDFPARPVRIITHSAPGGSPDALLRIVADRLSQMWGRQVLALNHPGAGGAVAARTAAAAAPDGYTLYMPASSAFVTLPGLQANLPLEVPRDFVPVGFVGEQPFFISVASSLGVATLAEFIALAKKRPGEISYAATGRGTLSHLAGEALQQRGAYLWSSTVTRRLRERCRPERSKRLRSARRRGFPTFPMCQPPRKRSQTLKFAAGSRWSRRSARLTPSYAS